MPKALINGEYVDVPAEALFQDDGSTPFVTPPPAPTGQTFTAEDLERVRQEEKAKLYTKLEENRTELTQLRDQVGSLTAAEQRREAQLEEEQARLEAERKKQEEEGLSAKELIARAREEWNQNLSEKEQEWNSRWEQEKQAREAAEAMQQKEREFGALRDYTLAQVEANKDKIAPELIQWIQGNSQEEIDSSIQQAIETTDKIAAQFQEALGGQQVVEQQPQPMVNEQGQLVMPVPQPAAPAAPAAPPVLPGTRATGGPGNTDPGAQFQRLSADDIANMDMSQYAKLRGQLGIGGVGQNRGLYG